MHDGHPLNNFNINDKTLVGLKTSILKHAKARDNLVTALDERKKLISEMPRRIEVIAEHRITGRQRPISF